MRFFGLAIPFICVTPYCTSRRERGSKYPMCWRHGNKMRFFDKIIERGFRSEQRMRDSLREILRTERDAGAQ